MRYYITITHKKNWEAILRKVQYKENIKQCQYRKELIANKAGFIIAHMLMKFMVVIYLNSFNQYLPNTELNLLPHHLRLYCHLGFYIINTNLLK